MASIFKTHPKFKCSFDLDIKNINDIVFFEKGDAFNPFLYQGKFRKGVIIKKKESIEELHSFVIIPEQINKIYYISKETDDMDENIIEYLMVARIDDSFNPYYYIILQAYCCRCGGFNCDKCYCMKEGRILIFFDKSILRRLLGRRKKLAMTFILEKIN